LTENPSNKSIKVIRIEELAPFPSMLIHKELEGVSQNANMTWVQEESMNEGAF
jgi:2-oxoglutarate dehydrogenase complex dehydrogenase (E1) component-like enzyme